MGVEVTDVGLWGAFCFFYFIHSNKHADCSALKHTGSFQNHMSSSPSHSKPVSPLTLAVETELSAIWKAISWTERLRSLRKSHHKTQVPRLVSPLRYYVSKATVHPKHRGLHVMTALPSQLLVRNLASGKITPSLSFFLFFNLFFVA